MEDDWSSEELDDGSHGGKKPVNRRPAGYWAEFNDWSRGFVDTKGRRPSTIEVEQWYKENSARVWPDETTRPTLLDTRVHGKSLRSKEAVKNYFRLYRSRSKGGSSSTPGAVVKRRSGSRAGGASMALAIQSVQHSVQGQAPQPQELRRSSGSQPNQPRQGPRSIAVGPASSGGVTSQSSDPALPTSGSQGWTGQHTGLSQLHAGQLTPTAAVTPTSHPGPEAFDSAGGPHVVTTFDGGCTVGYPTASSTSNGSTSMHWDTHSRPATQANQLLSSPSWAGLLNRLTMRQDSLQYPLRSGSLQPGTLGGAMSSAGSGALGLPHSSSFNARQAQGGTRGAEHLVSPHHQQQIPLPPLPSSREPRAIGCGSVGLPMLPQASGYAPEGRVAQQQGFDGRGGVHSSVSMGLTQPHHPHHMQGQQQQQQQRPGMQVPMQQDAMAGGQGRGLAEIPVPASLQWPWDAPQPAAAAPGAGGAPSQPAHPSRLSQATNISRQPSQPASVIHTPRSQALELLRMQSAPAMEARGGNQPLGMYVPPSNHVPNPYAPFPDHPYQHAHQHTQHDSHGQYRESGVLNMRPSLGPHGMGLGAMTDGPFSLGDGPLDWQEHMIQPRLSAGQGWEAAALMGRVSGQLQSLQQPLQSLQRGVNDALLSSAQSGMLPDDLLAQTVMDDITRGGIVKMGDTPLNRVSSGGGRPPTITTCAGPQLPPTNTNPSLSFTEGMQRHHHHAAGHMGAMDAHRSNLGARLWALTDAGLTQPPQAPPRGASPAAPASGSDPGSSASAAGIAGGMGAYGSLGMA